MADKTLDLPGPSPELQESLAQALPVEFPKTQNLKPRTKTQTLKDNDSFFFI